MTGRALAPARVLALALALTALALPARAGGTTTQGGGTAEPERLSPEGIWLTEDRDGAIEIYRCGDRLCGRLVWFDDQPKPEDYRRSGAPAGGRGSNTAAADAGAPAESLCRLQLIGDLVPKDDRTWQDGWIYDPEGRRTYSARLTLESATTLRIRGYIGTPLLGGSQLWTRAPAGQPTCTQDPRQPG